MRLKMDKIGYDDNGMNDYRFLEIFLLSVSAV